MLQLTDLGNRYQAVCTDVLAKQPQSSDSLINSALRRLMAERGGALPDSALKELLQLPESTLAQHADNVVFLFYASRVIRSPQFNDPVSSPMVKQMDSLADFAMRQPVMRTPDLVLHLQGTVSTAIFLHLRQNDAEGVATWLQRLEETCADPANCFAAYSGAVGFRDMQSSANTYRKLAMMLADRHGIGDWRTGVVAMALAGSSAQGMSGPSDDRESIYRPFLAEWIKADVLSRQPATIDWFMTIARARYERGDFRGSQEVTDYLWSKAVAGQLSATDIHPIMELAINTRVCLGQYDDAARVSAEFEKVWPELYAPRLHPPR